MNKILDPGRYAFRITYCDVNYISNAGNRNIKLGINIEHNNEEYICWEYLTKKLNPQTNLPYEFIVRKTSSLLHAIGKPELVGRELKNEDLLNETGFAIIKMESNPEYGVSNKVERFIYDKSGLQASIPTMSLLDKQTLSNMEIVNPKETEQFLDDDIPF